jgi:GT2 family glycosyltransferase
VATPPTTIGSVRVVVVAWNNASFIARTLEALLATVWTGRLEIVVVDNGSTDDSAAVVERFAPRVRLVRNAENLGFAGGNNVALRDLSGVDAVALINSDAFVTADWLGPLVGALEQDPGLGAACPKILFEPTFTEIGLDSPTFIPGGADRRVLGLRVTGVLVDGRDEWRRCAFASGWSWPEDHARWTTGSSRLWVPVLPHDASIEVFIEGEASPRRFDVGERFDVINNVGLELDERWYGHDRGFREIDRQQFDESTEVWGWCGAAVLLRSDYLRDVGLFDECYFAYYEDADLSWRGAKRGWNYRYTPASVVRHALAASSGEGSAFFDHLTQRNRLVVLTRHAPRRAAAAAWVGFVVEVLRHSWGEVVIPLVHGRRPRPTLTTRRIRSALAAVRMIAVGSRRTPVG